MYFPKILLRVLLIVPFVGAWCDASSQFKTENVVLITLDGLRWQELFNGVDPRIIKNKRFVTKVSETLGVFGDNNPKLSRLKLFPFIWSTIALHGQIYGNRNLGSRVNVANRYWFSYPGYNELLTGKPDRKINSNAKKMNKNETILEFANRHEAFKGKVAAFASWDVFHYIVNPKRSGIFINAGNDTAKVKITAREAYLNHLQRLTPSPWKATRFDRFTHNYAKEYLFKNYPRLILIAYGETDEFAHQGRYDKYLEAARTTDDYIRDIWESIQSDEHYKDKTTLLITTDHGRGSGRSSWRSHGLIHSGSNHTWFAIIGPDTQPLGEIMESGRYYTEQLAGTIATFLNLSYPENDSGASIILTTLSKQ